MEPDWTRGEVDGKFVLGYPVVLQGAGTGDPLERVVPHRGYVAADGRGGTQTGNDYFACHGITLCRCAGRVRNLGEVAGTRV